MSAKRKRVTKAQPAVAEFVPSPPPVYKEVALRRFPALCQDLVAARNACSVLLDLLEAATDDPHAVVSETMVKELRRHGKITEAAVGNAVMHLSMASAGMIASAELEL